MESSPVLNASSLPNDTVFMDCSEYFRISILCIVLSAAFFVLGLPIALLTLKELQQKSRQNVSSDLFMISTAMMNLVYIFLIPFNIYCMAWHYVPFECITSIMDGLTLCTRPLFMTCMCIDGYLAMFQPIAYRTIKKSIIRKSMTAIVWLSTIGFISYKCTARYAFPPPLNSAAMILSLPVIIFCDINAIQVLRQADPAKRKINPQKKRLRYTIICSLVMNSVVYTPAVIIFSFGDMIPMSRKQYKCTVAVFGFLLSMSGCVIMPALYLIYVGKLDDLRDKLKKVFISLSETETHNGHCV